MKNIFGSGILILLVGGIAAFKSVHLQRVLHSESKIDSSTKRSTPVLLASPPERGVAFVAMERCPAEQLFDYQRQMEVQMDRPMLRLSWKGKVSVRRERLLDPTLKGFERVWIDFSIQGVQSHRQFWVLIRDSQIEKMYRAPELAEDSENVLRDVAYLLFPHSRRDVLGAFELTPDSYQEDGVWRKSNYPRVAQPGVSEQEIRRPEIRVVQSWHKSLDGCGAGRGTEHIEMGGVRSKSSYQLLILESRDQSRPIALSDVKPDQRFIAMDLQPEIRTTRGHPSPSAGARPWDLTRIQREMISIHKKSAQARTKVLHELIRGLSLATPESADANAEIWNWITVDLAQSHQSTESGRFLLEVGALAAVGTERAQKVLMEEYSRIPDPALLNGISMMSAPVLASVQGLLLQECQSADPSIRYAAMLALGSSIRQGGARSAEAQSWLEMQLKQALPQSLDWKIASSALQNAQADLK